MTILGAFLEDGHAYLGADGVERDPDHPSDAARHFPKNKVEQLGSYLSSPVGLPG